MIRTRFKAIMVAALTVLPLRQSPLGTEPRESPEMATLDAGVPAPVPEDKTG